MTDYSKFDPLELAMRKLSSFDIFLSNLLESKKKKAEAIERDKHQYYDNPPYVWSDFRKFLAENYLQVQNHSFYIVQLLEIKTLAEECISKYSKLFAIPEQKLRNIFIDFPSPDSKTDYNKYSFKLNMEFCLKGSDYISRMIEGIQMDTKTDGSLSLPSVKAPITKEEGYIVTPKMAANTQESPPVSGLRKKDTEEVIFHGDKELSRYTGMSLTKIWRLKKAGKLQSYKVGRQYYYKQSEIDHLFKQST